MQGSMTMDSHHHLPKNRVPIIPDFGDRSVPESLPDTPSPLAPKSKIDLSETDLAHRHVFSEFRDMLDKCPNFKQFARQANVFVRSCIPADCWSQTIEESNNEDNKITHYLKDFCSSIPSTTRQEELALKFYKAAVLCEDSLHVTKPEFNLRDLDEEYLNTLKRLS